MKRRKKQAELPIGYEYARLIYIKEDNQFWLLLGIAGTNSN
jgi:hypothetical protein